MATTAAAAPSLFATLEDGIRRLGVDPLSAIKSFDIKTVGLVGAGILLAVLLVDLLGYLWAAFRGTAASFTPFSRSIVLTAADAWENRHDNFIGDYYDPYARARSLEPLTNVLDSLSSAVQKWSADPAAEGKLYTHPAAADRSFVFSS